MAAFSVEAFGKKYLGKSITKWSSSDFGQCIDLFRQYLNDRFRNAYYGIPRVGRARDIYAKADPKKWKKVPFKAGYVPPEGAVYVMSHGSYGHVGVVRRSSDRRVLRTIDENWSDPHRVAYEAHRYREIIGYLIPR